VSKTAFYGLAANTSFYMIFVGATVGAISLKIYLDSLENLIDHIMKKKDDFWRSLGSPELPLSLGFSSAGAGIKMMRFIFSSNDIEKSDNNLLLLRKATKNSFILFAVGFFLLCLGVAIIPAIPIFHYLFFLR